MRVAAYVGKIEGLREYLKRKPVKMAVLTGNHGKNISFDVYIIPQEK